MTEQELRALVRDAIARHAAAPVAPEPAVPAAFFRQHLSHAMFTLQIGRAHV